MLGRKRRTGTKQTKKITILNDVSSLFVLSQCVSCVSTWRFLHHVTATCKRPIGELITPRAWTRSGDETKVTSIRDSQVSVILVGVVIICFRLVSDKKLDKALLSGLSFKTLQSRSPKNAMGLFMVSA